MSWTKTRKIMLVTVPGSRREYVCVAQEERGDRTWHNTALLARGYMLDRDIEPAQAAEIQAVLRKHGYRRVLAMRPLTAHELIQRRTESDPRAMTLSVEF